MLTTGFIGGGRVARILIGGWAQASRLPDRVLVNDPSREVLQRLEAAIPRVEGVSQQEAASADVVFIALHPPVLLDVVSRIRPWLRREAVVVSLAPKIPIDLIETAAGTRRMARLIPNAPSLVGRGYNPVAFGAGLDDHARDQLIELFRPWGRAPEVAEQTLEAYAILTGMGPTYFWFQWQALRDLAGDLGLVKPEADEALRAMIEGSVATLLDAGLSPSAVMDLIPVKPLEEMESALGNAYRTVLPALYRKIQPVQSSVGSGS